MSVSLQTLIRPIVIRALLMREWWQSGITYNPISPRVYHNPYPKYAELRAKDPVHWSALTRSWIVSRYADVETILRDHKRFLQLGVNPLQPDRQPGMAFLDPPDHTRLRSLVEKAFSPRAIEALTPRIRELMEDLLDQIEDPSCFDIIETVAHPLPVIVTAALFGVPLEDRARFQAWSQQLARMVEPTITEREIQDADSAAQELDDYFIGIIDERRAEPREDLISTLAAVEEAGNTLTEDELLIMLQLLLITGIETTTSLIGNGLLALLRYPDQMQVLREDPGIMESAVEEFLRYDSPVQMGGRTTVEDVEIGGRYIEKDQSILVLIGAANHDPEVFRNPEQLDVTRNEANNIAFGRGIHHCLGAQLARIEGRIAFEAMLERFAEIHLAADHPPFKDNVVLRRLEALPVAAKARSC